MTLTAPLSVPVELRRQARWFRMASAVSITGVSLSSAPPQDLEGPIEVAFHLPGDADVIRCRAKVDRDAVRFLDLSATLKEKIQEYVVARRGLAHG